jgi:hypothetical protein
LDFEDEDDIFLGNISRFLPDCTALYPRREILKWKAKFWEY